MATITPNVNENIITVQKWLGLHQAKDGDTKLKFGEAAIMRNFRVTRDGNLQRRSGITAATGVMRTYALHEESEEEAFRTDNETCPTLSMYPDASAASTGFVSLSGEKEGVNFDNATTYTNYYYRKDKYHVWRLSSVLYDSDTGIYTWNGRPVKAVSASTDTIVKGMWRGNVNGNEVILCACDGKLWKVYANGAFTKAEIGDCDTSSHVHIFGFDGKAWVLDGAKYRVWDGLSYAEVAGYIPIVAVSSIPSGGGTELDQVNKLNGSRKVWFSPDGTSTAFQLPEKNLASIDHVKLRTDGSTLSATYDLVNGTFTFAEAPSAGENTIECQYTVSYTYRSQIVAMRYSELFNGTQDTRVFLYGDGSNKAFYSGLDYETGKPRADYFPDLNVMDVGTANTPITALIRHYSRMIAFKSDSAWTVSYGSISLESGGTTAGFYINPVNRAIGNESPGQAMLVLNSPRTLFGYDCYEWRNNGSYSSNLSVDERQAKRVSDRVYAILEGFDFSDTIAFDDNDNQEYYICYDGKALINNYANDTWYYYTGIDAKCMESIDGKTIFGTSDGRVCFFDDTAYSDFGNAIDAYWESGSNDFGRDFKRKYSSMLWITVKPETKSYVEVTAKTNRKEDLAVKEIVNNVAGTFNNWDFANFSFSNKRRPNVKKIKIKAKKYAFYKLVFESNKPESTVTILSADIRVRETGYAK